jgi:DNA-binding LacI/PurR family transcriptional regulator
MASKKITILDIAKQAGVSYQTVSRVLNKQDGVSADTRVRIQEIIETSGYQPNAAARSLVSSRTHTLGLITGDFSDYFFTQVIIGAEQEARKHGYFLMLGSTERNLSDEPVYLQLLAQQRVEGILFARPSTELETTDPPLRKLLKSSIPVVTTAYYLPGESLSIVDIDNFEGGQQATRCLTAAGHTCIAMITGPTGWRSVDERSAGYAAVLASRQIEYDSSLIDAGDWSYDSGYQAAHRLLAKRRDFTALFVQNDQMAMGALSALREAGLRTPTDVAVVGYDDIPGAAYSYPRLTTIRQPMQQVGRVAVQQLIQLINNPDAEKREILLQPELVRRETCGTLDKGGDVSS